MTFYINTKLFVEIGLVHNQYSYFVLKNEVTWKVFREFCKLIILWILMCEFSLRISILPPGIFAACAAILEKWRLKTVFDKNSFLTYFTIKVADNKLNQRKFSIIYVDFFYCKINSFTVLAPQNLLQQSFQSKSHFPTTIRQSK